MQLILDFPTVGERTTHRLALQILSRAKSVKFFKIEENTNPYVSKGEGETKVVRKGNRVDVWMTVIRSYYTR